jgi:hypothetical protein
MSADFHPMPMHSSAGTNATADALAADRAAAIRASFGGRTPEPPRPSAPAHNVTVSWRNSMRSFFPRHKSTQPV